MMGWKDFEADYLALVVVVVVVSRAAQHNRKELTSQVIQALLGENGQGRSLGPSQSRRQVRWAIMR